MSTAPAGCLNMSDEAAQTCVRKTFAHCRKTSVASAGKESGVSGGESHISTHSTEPFQCQTSLLCPPRHTRRANVHCNSHFPLMEQIICILTHTGTCVCCSCVCFCRMKCTLLCPLVEQLFFPPADIICWEGGGLR